MNYIMFKVDGHKFSPVFLKSIAIGPGCLEQAPKTGYYHVHCIVKLSHYSSVHLRPDILTELVNKRTSYSCYVNVRWTRYTSKGQDLQNLLNYMKKNDQPNNNNKRKTVSVTQNQLGIELEGETDEEDEPEDPPIEIKRIVKKNKTNN